MHSKLACVSIMYSWLVPTGQQLELCTINADVYDQLTCNQAYYNHGHTNSMSMLQLYNRRYYKTPLCFYMGLTGSHTSKKSL